MTRASGRSVEFVFCSYKKCVRLVVSASISSTGFSIADEDLATAVSAASSDDTIWPCAWDGPSGPIAQASRARRFPTALLLDGERCVTNLHLPPEEDRLVAQVQKLISRE